MRWVALRSKHAVIGEVRTADRWNAWLEARTTWGVSSVEGIVSRDQWDAEEEARRVTVAVKAEMEKERAEQEKAKAERRLLREITERVDLLQHYG